MNPSARVRSRRAPTAVIRAAAWMFLALVIAGCAEPEPAGQRLVILGFDGMDPELARRWMDAGKMPNFTRLAADGHFQALPTSNPPQSPVAWSSFATGHGPGDHGIFDFLRRDPGTYTPKFSISENMPAKRHLNLFGLRIPLDSGEVVNRRQGRPFWKRAEADGARASVLRVPVTYPPDDIHRMLSGMGVPDLLGTQGTYTLYSTTRVADSGSSARVVRVRPARDGRIETEFTGPPDPLKQDSEAMTVGLSIAPADPGVVVELAGTEMRLVPGEWSDWVRVTFDVTGPTNVSGTVRMLLVRDYPRLRLYVSPIQIDPMNPAVVISSPSGYAADLADRIGLYHTIGMPEETWSLNEEHISDQSWLDMEKSILAEREAMWYDTLDRNDSELVVGVFVQTDRVSHMFYRGLDALHPRHQDTAPAHRDAVEWIYTEADRILGETLARLDQDDELIVISDHGFAPFRRAVHLNRWLVANGWLVLEDEPGGSEVGFSNVDWSRSRAYALGLNGIYFNVTGRESEGIVDPDDVDELGRDLRAGLEAWRDAATGQSVISRVFVADDVYPGKSREDAPDLVVGYERGYRASWQTTLGSIPEALIEPNRNKWSGDHCIDPALVPGVMFSTFRPATDIESIRDISDLAQARLGRIPPK